MAVTEDIARLVLDIQGGAKMATEIERNEAVLRDLQQSLQAGAVSFEMFEEQAEIVTVRLQSLRAASTTIDEPMEQVVRGTEKAKGGMAGFGQSAVQAGRFIQDFQAAGVMGIANNLEQLAMSLGLGAGVAGGLTLLATAYLAFKPQIEEFFKGFSGIGPDLLKDRLTTLQEQIKLLEDKPHKVALDIQQLDDAREEVDRIKAALEAVEQLRTSQTKAERESGRRVGEALEEAGGPEIEQQLRGQIEGELLEGGSQAVVQARLGQVTARARLRELQEGPREFGETPTQRVAAIADAERQLRESEQRIKDAEAGVTRTGGEADIELGKVLDPARTGAGAAQERAQQELGRRLRMAGMGSLADVVAVSSPDVMRKAQVEEERKPEFDRLARERQASVDRTTKIMDEQDEELREQDEKGRKEQADERKKVQERTAKAESATLEEGFKIATGTSIDERAALYAAQLRAQGGIQDQYGRFRPLSAEQQGMLVQQRTARELAIQQPGLSAIQRGRIAGRITEGATQQAGDVLNQQRTQAVQQARQQYMMTGRLTSTAAINAQATENTLNILESVIPLLSQVERQGQTNLRRSRAMQPRTKSQLRTGGGGRS